MQVSLARESSGSASVFLKSIAWQARIIATYHVTWLHQMLFSNPEGVGEIDT